MIRRHRTKNKNLYSESESIAADVRLLQKIYIGLAEVICDLAEFRAVRALPINIPQWLRFFNNIDFRMLQKLVAVSQEIHAFSRMYEDLYTGQDDLTGAFETYKEERQTKKFRDALLRETLKSAKRRIEDGHYYDPKEDAEELRAIKAKYEHGKK